MGAYRGGLPARFKNIYRDYYREDRLYPKKNWKQLELDLN